MIPGYKSLSYNVKVELEGDEWTLYKPLPIFTADDPCSDLDYQALYSAGHVSPTIGEQEPDVTPADFAPSEDAQPLLALLSIQKKLSPSDKRNMSYLFL